MSQAFETLRANLRLHPSKRAARLLSENRQLREAIAIRWPDTTFIGTSPAGLALRREMDAAAVGHVAVLLSGERGSGKGLVAQLLHRSSSRADGPFVVLGCAGSARRLVGPELFGLKKRGPGGRVTRRLGRLELADGGTLFLDEVGELPLELQPRLLSFLRHGSFQRIGSAQRIPAQVRIVSSTTGDPKAMARARSFNRDLYTRLKASSLRVPPLRERWEDIPALTDWFLSQLGRRQGRPPAILDEEARKSLLRYPWPGNLRELQGVLVRASVNCRGGLIGIDDLPSEVASRPDASASATSSARASSSAAVRLVPGGIPLRDIERLAITQTLAACHGNRAETARRLGLSKKGFYLKMKRLGIWTSAR